MCLEELGNSRGRKEPELTSPVCCQHLTSSSAALPSNSLRCSQDLPCPAPWAGNLSESAKKAPLLCAHLTCPPVSSLAHFSFHWLTAKIVPDFIEMLLKSSSLLFVLISFALLMGYFLSPGLLHQQVVYYSLYGFIAVSTVGDQHWERMLMFGTKTPNYHLVLRKPFTVWRKKSTKNKKKIKNLIAALFCINK